jgi:Tfp pilus assembly protein PilN
MGTLKRFFSYLGILLAVLLIAAFAVGIFFSWQINASAKTAALNLLTTGENLVSTVQQGVVSVETRVDTLYANTSGVESALNKISSDIEDQGLILTLLPPEKEKELTDSIKEVVDVFNSVRDTLLGIKQLYSTINEIPFVNLPLPDDDLIQQATQVTEKLEKSVNDLSTKIQDFRTKSASTVDALNAIVSDVNTSIENFNNALNQLDQQLYATQTGLARLKTVVSPLFNLITIVFDILLAWMIFANVAVIRWSLQVLRATKIKKSALASNPEPDAMPEPEQPADTFTAESTLTEVEPSNTEDTIP